MEAGPCHRGIEPIFSGRRLYAMEAASDHPVQPPLRGLFTMRMHRAQQEILRRAAAEKGITQADLIRAALDHYGVPGMLTAT